MILASVILLVQWVAAATLNHGSPATDISPLTVGGCGKLLPQNQVPNSIHNMTIRVGSVDRKYLVFIPPLYAQQAASPLILSFHGGLQTAEKQLELDNLTSPDFNMASIVVYPKAHANAWEGVPGVTTDDLLFTSELITRLESLYCIDPNRIFATGKSDGGGFCGVLACDSKLSTRIAAFAPVSGAFYVDTCPCDSTAVNVPCSPGRTNIPFLEFHGGVDNTIPYEGGSRHGECLPSIPNYMTQWVARDHLLPDNDTSMLEPDTFVYRWGNGAEAGLVTLVYDTSIGHDWPASFPNPDNQRRHHKVASFNATSIIMDFFTSHHMELKAIEEL